MQWLARKVYGDPFVHDGGRSQSIRWFMTTFFLVLLFCLFAALLLAWSVSGFSYFRPAPNFVTFLGIAMLTGAAGFAGGGLLGFLFGVPRVQTAEARADADVASNTNLEQVSDWLTKIIVGVGLVEFPEIARQLRGFADQVDLFMRAVPSDVTRLAAGGTAATIETTSLAGMGGAGFAAALVLVGASIAGFLCAYLISKTGLMAAFAQRAHLEGKLGEVVYEQIMGEAARRVLDRPGFRPEECARDMAAKLLQLAPADTTDPKLAEMMGAAHAITKNFRTASESFRRAIKLRGKDASADLVGSTVRTLAASGEPDLALGTLETHKAAFEKSQTDRYERALLEMFARLYARGGHEQAIAIGEELKSGLGNSGRLWFYFAVAYGLKHADLALVEPPGSQPVSDARNQALDAVKRAIQLDPEVNKPALQLLWDPTLPGKDRRKNSLESLYQDTDFAMLLK